MVEVVEFGDLPEALAYVKPPFKTIYIGSHPNVRKMTPQEIMDTIHHENLHQVFRKIPEIRKPTPTKEFVSDIAAQQLETGAPEDVARIEDIKATMKVVTSPRFIGKYSKLPREQQQYLSGVVVSALEPTLSEKYEAGTEVEHRGITLAERAMRVRK